LRDKLSRPELKQFAQRVSVDFHLRPLDRHETHAYIGHRIRVAGGDAALFLPEAIEFMHARTNGVPRLLNQLGDFALVYAFADGRTTIDADLIAQVVRDRSGGESLPTFPSVDPAPAGVTNGSAA
jgi:general secretion pathway protein A